MCYFSDPCLIKPATLNSTFTVPTLGSTAPNGSLVCTVPQSVATCCTFQAIMFTWLKNDTNISSDYEYTIVEKIDAYSFEEYRFMSILSINGTVTHNYAGKYHCEAVSNYAVNVSTSSVNLTVKCKWTLACTTKKIILFFQSQSHLLVKVIVTVL